MAKGTPNILNKASFSAQPTLSFFSSAGQRPQAPTANDGKGHLKRLETSLADTPEVSYAEYTQLNYIPTLQGEGISP